MPRIQRKSIPMNPFRQIQRIARCSALLVCLGSFAPLHGAQQGIRFFTDTYPFVNDNRCVGYSMTAVLFKAGKFSPSDFQSDAQTVFELRKANVTAFIQHFMSNAHVGVFQRYLDAEWRHLGVADSHRKLVEKVRDSPGPLAIAYGHHAVVAHSYARKADGSHVIRIYDNNLVNGSYSLVYPADFSSVEATARTEMRFGLTGRSGAWAVTPDEILKLLPAYPASAPDAASGSESTPEPAK